MNDMRDELAAPKIVERSTFEAELKKLRVREKAHTRGGDAIAAARRRLPMVEVDGDTPLVGERGAGTPDAHRLLLHVARRPPCARAVIGMHVGYIAGS